MVAVAWTERVGGRIRGWGKSQCGCGYGLIVLRNVLSLRRNVLPAALEALAPAVHLQGVEVVGETVMDDS